MPPLAHSNGSLDLQSKLSSLAKITHLDIATNDIGVGATIGLSFTGGDFKATAKFGYLGVDFMLQDSRLASLKLVDIHMNGQVNQTLEIPALLAFAPEDASLPDKVADIINPVLNGGEIPVVKAGAKGLVFGSSQTEMFDFLSGIQLDTTVDLKTILGSASSGKLPLDLISNLDVSPNEQGFTIKVKAKPGAVGVETVSFKLGYLDLGISIEKSNELLQLAKISARDLKAIGGGSKDLEIPITVDLAHYDPRVPNLIAALVDSLIKKNPIPPNSIFIRGGGLYFGSDESHKFSIFSKVSLKLDVTKLVPSASIDPSAGLAALPFEIISVIGGMNDNLVLGFDAKLKLKQKLPVPVSLSLDYAALEAWIGNSPTNLPPRDGSNFPGIFSNQTPRFCSVSCIFCDFFCQTFN